MDSQPVDPGGDDRGLVMNIKVVDELHESLIEEAWALYHEAFEELNAQAVQRHLMYRGEFDEVMRDRRVQKYLYFDDRGALGGLATYTNRLEAVPLISPQYFQRRWPRRYAERRIWYIGFIAVNPRGRALHALTEMVEGMRAVAAARNGIVGLDICRFNGDGRHMSRAIGLLVGRLAGSPQVERADEQSYLLLEFPDAA
jgi:hypothetical protein